MPGKRKRDEEEPYSHTVEGDSHHHGTTVFVSNLPYTATSTDLKTLFSDVAPVKNAFVVLEKESKVSKGVGYVTFAMQEDAQACIERQTIDMNGRALRIGWAGLKPKPGESSPLKTSKPPKTTNASPKPKSLDPNAIRTIVITGLPNGVDSKVLWKKVRKQEGADTVTHPFTDPDGSEDATKAEVLFTSPAQAMHAIERLNAHVFKGSTLGVTLKKRMEKQPNRASRLIVRNLPWNTTESDLRTLFLLYGPVYSVEIPTESGDTRRKPKAKGFAFVWMTSKIDAEKAIAGVNGKMLKERPIAVDWALSKSKWEGVKDQVEAEIDAQDQVEGEKGSDSEGGSENEKLDDSSDEGLGVHADGDVSMHSGSEEDEEEDKEGDEDDRGSPSKPELPPPEAGTTLFIRNVPWEATEDDLRQLFKAFGSLRYVRIVMDHESGRSKGTAFACYWKKEDADKVAAISQTLSKDVNMDTVARNPFSAPSLLTPDPSSSLARNLVIHGRTLDVVLAVTQETAGKLRDVGVKMREKADKRNLYLMREGVIFPNSPAASTIPPAELEKRMNSFNARRNLIQTNPSLYVSKTRLSIRQLPTFVSERLLKRLARHAIKAFDEETEKGERDGLEEDEMDDEGGKKVVDPLSGGEVALSAKEPKGEEKKKTGRKGKWSSGAVKQAKIVRLSERVDPLTGKGKSKGYGFLETEKHADALKILRWANNNPETGSLFRLWWVDEMKEALDVLEKKTGKKSEEEIARMKRLKEVIATSNEDGVEKAGSKRTLVVEFSIENVVIIKKREGRDKTSGPTHVDKRNQKHKLDTDRKDESKPSKEGKSRASRKSTNSKRNEEENSRPSKRPRMEQGNPNATPLGARIGEKRPSNPLGSIIGRKRKMKKMNSGRK